jgi:hypothetical protein
MTREEIIEMVEEAGPLVSTPFDVWCERFADLVAAAERERIAKLFDGPVWAYDYRQIAALIRAGTR